MTQLPVFPTTTQADCARHLLLASAITAALVLGACATTPPPTEQIAVSKAAVARAAGAGAAESAPVDLGTARDKLERAQAAMVAKDNDRALMLARDAQLDAQVAEAKARASRAQKAANEVQESSRVLREEMGRKAP